MSVEHRAPLQPMLLGRLGIVVFVVISASIAALLAHIGIDVAGDYVLAHDTYDDIAHGSRAMLSLVALVGVIVIAVRYLGALIDQARHARPLADVALKLGARELVQYASIVVGVTFILLGTMEALDAALAGQRVDDVRDLLGGSLWLAAGVTIPTAVGVVALLWQLISSLIGAQSATLSILRALIIARPTRSAASAAGVRRRPRRRKRLTFPARSTHKRGPPGPGGSFARSS